MQCWDYHWAKAGAAEELYERIAQEGEEGWELVSVTVTPGRDHPAHQMIREPPPATSQAWLKRPIPEE